MNLPPGGAGTGPLPGHPGGRRRSQRSMVAGEYPGAVVLLPCLPE